MCALQDKHQNLPTDTIRRHRPAFKVVFAVWKVSALRFVDVVFVRLDDGGRNCISTSTGGFGRSTRTEDRVMPGIHHTLLRFGLASPSRPGDGAGAGTLAKPLHSTDSLCAAGDTTALRSPSRLTCRTCAVAFFQMALRPPKTVRDWEWVRMIRGGLAERSFGDEKTKFDDRSPGRSMAARGGGVGLALGGTSNTAVTGAGGRVLWML